MAKFKPGQSGNPKGRTPGVKSKSAEAIRKIIGAVLSEYLDREVMLNDLKRLDSKDRLTAIDRLLKHYLPPPQEEFLRLSDEDFQRLINELSKRTNHEPETKTS